MTKKKKKSRFKGIVSRNAAKQARGSQYAHLNLPKGIGVFREEPKTRVNLDIIPYIVTGENHPDRDDEYGIATPGGLWYRRPYFLHRNIGAGNETIVCPASIKKRCPICEHRAQLLKDGADWNDDAVRALKPSQRNLYVVIPKGHKDYDEKIHIWDISQYLFQEKLNEEIQENEEYETFPDLEEGYTLRIRFSEGQMGTNKFADCSRIDFIERKKPYDASILEEAPSLDDLLVILSYKAISALFFGGMTQEELPSGGEEDEEESEEEESEEEESEEEESEEEESEEEESEEEESEEEESEEEEEEEEEEERRPTRTKHAERTKTKKAKGKESDREKSDNNKKKGKEKCPHGHRFGKDIEEYDECEICEIWEKCLDASEAAER